VRDDHRERVDLRPGGTALRVSFRMEVRPERSHMVRRTVISQLASVSEEALGKLAQSPATRNALQGAMNVKDRVEKVVRSLDGMEKRVASIEKRLAALEKTPAKKATPRPRAKTAAKPAAKPTPKS
jgi:hypothetical protein